MLSNQALSGIVSDCEWTWSHIKKIGKNWSWCFCKENANFVGFSEIILYIINYMTLKHPQSKLCKHSSETVFKKLSLHIFPLKLIFFRFIFFFERQPLESKTTWKINNEIKADYCFRMLVCQVCFEQFEKILNSGWNRCWWILHCLNKDTLNCLFR